MSTLADFADTVSFGLVHTIRKKTHLVKDHVSTTTTSNDRISTRQPGKHANSQNFTLRRSHSTSSFIPSSLRCSRSSSINESKQFFKSIQKNPVLSNLPTNESNEMFQSITPKRSLSHPMSTKTIIKSSFKSLSVENSTSTINIELNTIIPSPKATPEKRFTIFDQPIDLESGQTIDKLSNQSVPSLIQDDDSGSLYSVNPEIQFKVELADNIFPGYP